MLEKLKIIEEQARAVAKRYRTDFDTCYTKGIDCLEKDFWEYPEHKIKRHVFYYIREAICPRRTVSYNLYRGDIVRHLEEGMQDNEIIEKYKLGEQEYFSLKSGKAKRVTKQRRIHYCQEWDNATVDVDTVTNKEAGDEYADMIEKFFNHIDDFGLTEQEEKLCVLVLTDYGLDIENETEEVLEMFGFKHEGQLESLFKKLEYKLKTRSPFRVLKDDS